MTEPDDDMTFLDMGGHLPPLSPSAFQLHGFAVISSIKDGTPGVVSDDYLNAISAETTTAALELEVAGVWERREDGYFIVNDEILKIALDWGEENDATRPSAWNGVRTSPPMVTRTPAGSSAPTSASPRTGLTVARWRFPTAAASVPAATSTIMTTPEPKVATPTTPISGLPSSTDLKARIVDFMERADELLTHELADYKAPFTLNVTMSESTGDVLGYELDHRLLDKEKLVYFATIQRPILWTENEPIYITHLISALGKEHPNLRQHCVKIADIFKDWKNRLFIGTKSGVSDPEEYQLPPSEDRSWKITNVYTAPVGTPLPEDQLVEAPMVEDMYYAKVYLNGFVWHNDAPKTAEYRAATELEQLHYRKCAEIRVFSGLQMVIKPVHQFFLDARAAGEDL